MTGHDGRDGDDDDDDGDGGEIVGTPGPGLDGMMTTIGRGTSVGNQLSIDLGGGDCGGDGGSGDSGANGGGLRAALVGTSVKVSQNDSARRRKAAARRARKGRH